MSIAFTKGLTLQIVRISLELGARLWPTQAGQLALRIFSTPRKGRLLPGQYPWLDEARVEPLQVEGLLIQAYHWPGTGPQVMLLHGWESNTGRWEGMLAALQAAGFEVTAIDAPAHGYSTGSQFTAVFYARCLAAAVARFKPAAIVGHSAGGMAAFYGLAKLDIQAGIKKLVAIGTPAGLLGLVAAYKRILGVSEPVINSMEAAAMRRHQVSLKTFSIPSFAEHLSIPGLIIHDQSDELAGVAEALAIQGAWPRSQLSLTQGLGHSTQSPVVWQEVVRFLLQEEPHEPAPIETAETARASRLL